MKKISIGLVCALLLFLGIPFSSAFTNFLISPETADFSLASLETRLSDITVSFSTVVLPQEDEPQPYRIEKHEVCNQLDEDWNCIDPVPDLCSYISIQPNGGEGDESGFPLDYYFPWNVAEGELNNPTDLTDDWTLSVTAPCFEGECPADYDAHLHGDPLPQSLKNQTFACDLAVVWNGGIFPVKGLTNTAYAAITNITRVEAVFTGSATPQINPVIIVPGIVGTELYNDSDLIWPDLIQMATDINDQFLTENLNLDENGNSTEDITVGDVIRNILDVPVLNVDIFKSLVIDLENNNYQENQNLFFFPYDWRLNLDSTKDLLNQRIEEIKSQTGADKVDIIAHSMGGLLVEDYLNQYGKESIDKLIFVGTPHLGAPKAGKVLLEGDRFNIIWLEEDRIKEIAHNSPALHELLPSPTYFNTFQGYLRNYSFLGNNELLDYANTKNLLLNEKNQNSTMFQLAENFYDRNLQDFNFSGVETYNISGCKRPTQAAYSFDIFGGIGQTGYTSGDGTVPLVSADYVNIPAEDKFYVKNGNHAELPSTNGVKELILDILQGNQPNLSGNISGSQNFCNVNGKSLAWHSPVKIHVYDSNGNHTGPIDGGIEYGIPGIDYDVMGHDKFMFLPTDEGQEYQIEAVGEEEGSFDLVISDVQDGEYQTTRVFNDVPVNTSDTASFTISQSEDNENITLENDEGIFEVPSDAIIERDSVQDLTPPETEITAELVKDKKWRPKKELLITLKATDDNSGILTTEYSLDDGNTFNEYSEPFTLNDKKTDTIMYYSVDKAGNNEEVQELNLKDNKSKKCKSWRCLEINKKHNVIKKVYQKIGDKDKNSIKNLFKLKFKRK